MATILSQRSSNLSTFNAIAINYSTLTGSTIVSASTITTSSIIDTTINTISLITSSLTLNSTMVSLGQSTNQTYTTLAQGAVSTVGNWNTSLASLVSTKIVSMSANAQYQLAITQVSTTTSVQYTSTLGTTWSAISGVSGLPTATQTNYIAGAVSGNGKYQIITPSKGYPYLSNNYGSTFTSTNINTGTPPNYYFPFDNSLIDVQGATTLTAYGTVGYTTGPTGTGALSLSNTAGAGSITNYVRGPITVGNNFTLTCLFNFVTLPSVDGQYAMPFSLGTSSSDQVTINYYYGAQYTGFYVQYTSTSGLASILGAYAITTNTWYSLRILFQGGNTTYIYINNVQVASAVTTNTNLPITQITFGGDNPISATGGGFNGYIDEFRIWNTNTPLLPPLYTSFERDLTNNSYDDSGQTKLSVIGTFTYGTGIVGSRSAFFNNTTNNIASYYYTMPWPGSANFTVSGWFYPTSFSTGGNTPVLFTTYNGSCIVVFNTSGTTSSTIIASMSSGTIGSTTVSTNTWYYFTYIFQTNGLCSFYLNNVLIGTATNSGGTGGNTQGPVLIGTAGGTTGGNYPFIGYMDDIRVYTYAISVNYTNTAISASGQYMLLTSPTGLFMSSNYGSVWSLVSAVPLSSTQQNAAISASGQYMLTNYGITTAPQSASANATSWTANGITWVATSSSNYNTNYLPYVAFNNIYTGGTLPYSWASNFGYTNGGASAISPASGSITTSINFAGTPYFSGGTQSILGNYLQIQSSSALIMYNYNFSCGNGNQIPHTYYIVGSNDNTIWYPIQYATANTSYVAPGTVGSYYTSPFSSPTGYDNAGPTSNLLLNYTGTQTISYLANTPVPVSTTAFSTTTASFIYFRIVIMALYSNAAVAEIEEWGINFVGQSYSTNYGTTWTPGGYFLSNTSYLAISGTGQYAITVNGQTAYIVSNYLAGFSTNVSTTPTLTSINANIAAAALSNTGQYMVIVTAGTTNNLYYSSNYGSTFTGLTLGSTALTSCAISHDGSYITVANATTVYTLNNNSNGYSVAIGSQAGASNQMQNAISIGTQAGYVNQEQNSIAIGAYAGQNFQAANSIVLNASGQALNAVVQGFYVAPITAYTTSSGTTSLLVYGSDNQIVQANIITLLSSGYVGIGTTIPTSVLQVAGTIAIPLGGTIAGSSKTFDIPHPLSTGKQLVHSLIEGPRCDLIYRGTTVLNNGMATVYIDTQCTYDPQCSMDQGTFAALCTNPQYFLQNMTNYNRVTGTIVGGILTIRCQNTTATDTIGWMVIAERADPFIKQWNRTNANGYLITQYSQ